MDLYVLEYYYRVDGYLFKEPLGFFTTKEKAEEARKEQLSLWTYAPPYNTSTIDPHVEKSLIIRKYPMDELISYD